MKKIVIIAGEASGDHHGAQLIKAMQRQSDSRLRFIGIGGDQMHHMGLELIYHSAEVAFLGFAEVIKHLPFIRQMMRSMTELLDRERPDLVILIDYPGFNLRFAKSAKARQIPIFYYISPQVWAWNKGRIPKIARLVDRMAVIFPFEADLYRQEGLDVHFVGHPLLDTLKLTLSKSEFCQAHGFNPELPLLAILPGSRQQEIQRLFPTLLLSALAINHQIKGLQIAVAKAPTLSEEFLQNYLKDFSQPVKLIANESCHLISAADVVLVKSGTATLETGIIGKPMIIVYKVNWFSYLMARVLVKIPNIGLVNVVAGQQVVPELIQHHATPTRIADLAVKMFSDEDYRQRIINDLKVIKTRLGSPGAAERAGRLALEMINL